IAGYRLATPIGYWNGLGAFCAIGLLLAVGFVVHGRVLAGRVLAGASVVVLIVTMYFTFGRGPWIALGFGVLVAVALDSERLKLVSALLALAPASLSALVLSSRAHALTTATALLGDAARQGHRLLVWLVLLAALSGAVAGA